MYLGSGLASSIPMYHQGPVVMGKAFVQGFTVMAVLDQVSYTRNEDDAKESVSVQFIS